MCSCSMSSNMVLRPCIFFFFFNDTATTEIYTLSLHDALPIFTKGCELITKRPAKALSDRAYCICHSRPLVVSRDRKSTRLNSSHVRISYAVFCLKKKSPRGRSAGDVACADDTRDPRSRRADGA